MSLPNVVGVGLGYKVTGQETTSERCLAVFVSAKLPPEAVPAAALVPKKLDDVPTDVVEVGQIQIHAGRTERWRPVPPGVSIGHIRVTAGTLGTLVSEPSTGRLLILSNNHVLANESDGTDGRCAVGDPIVQPGVHDKGNPETDTIGRLVKFIPIRFASQSQEPSCPTARRFENVLNRLVGLFWPDYFVKVFKQPSGENLVDAALAAPLDPAEVQPEILEIGAVQGVVEAKPGMAVKKSGRTTGLTHGQVTHVAVRMIVGFSGGRSAVFTDQFLTGPMSSPGDSGSLVLNGQNQAVGLLFAGSDRATVCNRIQNVLGLLGVAL
ncbi:hypothetical protein Daudx_0451 [Candidatus Desulforudis audaxviator]|nr:hypothetical protein Daudx_0451 [Candidatus Desulforudis audaxviator]